MSKDFQHDNPDNWKWGIFYYNRQDHRLVVPKRIPVMGWTFNFAHPAGYIFLALLTLIIIFQIIASS